MPSDLVEFVRDIYKSTDFIPLHQPCFGGNEKKYLSETIDSTFVSSVGKFVDQFEQGIEQYTGCTKAVATVNGTAALHAALYLAGVSHGDLVVTQSLTFVATCNAIHQLGAKPVFVDIDASGFGLSPTAASDWLSQNAVLNDQGVCVHVETSAKIKALVPMHTFGHPAKLHELEEVCQQWNLALIEDAAESLGSLYKGDHTGTFGQYSALSFNGNKIMTTGGGGMLLCRSADDGARAKHVTTTAKKPHRYEFYHDEAGFNYRMPNINAALGCAQLELLPRVLTAKRKLASSYEKYFSGSEYQFVAEPDYAISNYWLNAVICSDVESRNHLLETTNSSGVMTRPVWQLMHRLPMYEHALRGDLPTSEWAESRLVNLPSTPPEF